MLAPELILASASPRRSELLTRLGIRHSIAPVDMDERRRAGESPLALVKRLARGKAIAARDRDGNALPVLAADTVVCLGDRVFNKPFDRQDARAHLQALSGVQHEVLTAICLAMTARSYLLTSRSLVKFRRIEKRELENYLDTGESHDKAGAYAIQGLAAIFIEEIKGSYSGIMGLPIYETCHLLKRAGIDPLRDTSERPQA